MSLLKQLLISVSLAILLILGGVLWLNVDSARNYLNTQLQLQADSAVTSLALTLSQPSNQDSITQELIIAALFDTGQFSRIVLLDTQNKALVVRELESSAQSTQAPEWFVHGLPIVAAEAGAQVSDGWRQVGQLYLQTDASYARDNLWQNFVRSGVWVLGAGALWAFFVLFLIRWLRRVLHQEVAEQLLALSKGDQPATPYKKATFAELEEVSQAIASARQSIAATTEEQHAKIESLQIELNQDEVTGLVNRKYFVNELRRQLEQGSSPAGWLLLFRQRDLAAINKVMTRANVDEWLRSLSQQLQALLSQYPSSAGLNLARLNGSDFVLLMPNLDETQRLQLLHDVQLVLRQQRIHFPHGEYCRWALAQTDFQPGQFLAHVLARLDQALMRAESAGHHSIETLTGAEAEQLAEQPKGGEDQWRALIQDALMQQGFSLEFTAKQLQHQSWQEAFLALHSGSQTMLGYQFMPVATRLGLSAMCDLRALELALTHLQQPTTRVLLRVSLSSIVQEGFVEQVQQLLATAQTPLSGRLAIELDAYALSSEPIQVAAFNQVLAQFGALRGARRVLQLPRVLLDLNSLNVSYIRLFTDDITEFMQKAAGEELLKSVLVICQKIAINVVVDGDSSQLNSSAHALLQEYGINVEQSV